MNESRHRVCPVEHAGSLDNHIRKLLQNPRKILKPYLEPGMTVVDVGCGPGFFTLDMARMVGREGKVIAVDLQEGMLRRIESKIKGTELENRIILHKCEQNSIGVKGQADFILLFYIVHEVSDKRSFFRELFSILNPDAQILMVEPPFHVSRLTFQKTLQIAQEIGFIKTAGPPMLFQKTALLMK